MVLGLLSDTHSDSAGPRFEALLSGPLGRAEALLHAGDYTGAALVDHLEFVDPRPFYGVVGNTDGPGLEGRLPQRRIVELGGVRIGLVHGWGAAAGLEERVLGAFPEPVDVIVFGHSHRPSRGRHGSTSLVNPGSAFHGRGAAPGTVALLDLGPGGVEVAFLESGR